MYFPASNSSEQGSALVVAIIVLALLTAIGFAALDVADLNINIAANDREAKEAFFHADAGTNIGHKAVEELFDRKPFGNDAHAWKDSAFNATEWQGLGSVLEAYRNDPEATYVRIGQLGRGVMPGGSMAMASGYRGVGYTAKFPSYADFLIRSHRTGHRDSEAEVEIGWKSIGGGKSR